MSCSSSNLTLLARRKLRQVAVVVTLPKAPELLASAIKGILLSRTD